MHPNAKIAEIRSRIKQTLSDLYDEHEIRNFTDLIFYHVLNYSKIDIRLKGDEVISKHFISTIDEILARLKVYEPIQYVLGETVFFDLPLIVSPDVLIPRPETEELVDWIIRENEEKNVRILDIGTGSGCIAIALSKSLPHAKVTGCDISEKALETARKNAERHHVQIPFLKLDVLKHPVSIDEEYDIIVSNPPYVRESEKKSMLPNVLNYEPHTALFVPDDGPLIFYSAVASIGCNILRPGGIVYCEINEALPEESMTVFYEKNYAGIEMRRDINGKPRMIKAYKR